MEVTRPQDQAVAVLEISALHPFGLSALQTVQSALQAALRDPAVGALVLHIQGPDSLPEVAHALATATASPRTRDAVETLVQCLERADKPLVVALQGFVAGIPLELALACSGRVALDSAQLAVPDVLHGVIPGTGSLQRLVGLLGISQTWELVHKGQAQMAHQFASARLFDKVVESDVLGHACALARELLGHAAQPGEAPRNCEPDKAAIDTFCQEQRNRLGQRQRLQAVLGALLDALQAAALPFDEACRQQEAILQTLRAGSQAPALAHVAQAEQRTRETPADDRHGPRPTQQVAVIGAGTMGTGIAISLLDAGCTVTLLERDQAALDAGCRRISEHYQGRARAGRMKTAVAAACEARLRPTTQWAALQAADLVIEAVFEDLEVKRAVFQQMDTHARAGAILATNTSYLNIDDVARVTRRASDVLGLHFFSPANVMKLLEVVRTPATAADVIATGMALARRLGKIPVLSGQSFGFIGNRIYNAYRCQCECMLEDGAWPEDVDAALEAFGFAMGPFAVADLSGLDIAWRMRRAQAATRDARERYVPILDHLCELGRLGRKANAGYYTYAEGKRGKTSDSVVRAIISQASAARGLVRRPLAPADIQQRALLAMANEAALVVAEGVAACPADVDVVLVQGYGFPRWEGGPLYWASRQDPALLQRGLQALAASLGHGFVAAEDRWLRPSTGAAPAHFLQPSPSDST